MCVCVYHVGELCVCVCAPLAGVGGGVGGGLLIYLFVLYCLCCVDYQVCSS